MAFALNLTTALVLVGFAFNGAFCDFSRQGSPSPWTWTCQNKFCLREPTPNGTARVPMDVCKLNCDDVGSLLPLPTGTTVIGKAVTPIYPAKISFTGYEAYPVGLREMLGNATEIFRGYLLQMNPNYDGTVDPFPTTGVAENNSLIVTINIMEQTDLSIRLGTDESYTLQITVDPDNRIIRANIQAATYYGGRHGLETLSQLIAYDDEVNALQVVNTGSIVDAPVYPYRGAHLDTSRNYFSVQSIKKIIDGMSYNKLNMFHWHITDTHSFPMEVLGYPQFAEYGAYNPRKIYTLADMRDIVEYARIRGVKVVAEFDEPAHTGSGWEWGPEKGLGELVVCNDKQPWHEYCVEPPCGQLNIVNEEMYTVLGDIFKSMLAIFDNDLFHMGGDEVDFRCYNTTPEITDWMTANNFTRDNEGFLNLWSRFQNKAHQKLLDTSTNQTLQSILFTSGLTEAEHIEKYLNTSDYIIQIWSSVDDPIISELLNRGYRTIFSNYDVHYLDCGFQAWIGNGFNWCSPYHGWQVIYEHSPYKIYANATNSSMADSAWANGLLLGSETLLWTEQADELSAESRIFPRASAHAERLWTNPMTTGWMEAEIRMVTNRERFVQRGLGQDRLQPEYCSQHQNRCYGPPEVEDVPEDKGSTGALAVISHVGVLLLSTLAVLFV